MKTLLKISLLAVWMIGCRPLLAQNAYYDALKLSRLQKAGSVNSYANDTMALNILANYMHFNGAMTVGQIIDSCKKNALLVRYISVLENRQKKIDSLVSVYMQTTAGQRITQKDIRNALWRGDKRVLQKIDSISLLADRNRELSRKKDSLSTVTIAMVRKNPTMYPELARAVLDSTKLDSLKGIAQRSLQKSIDDNSKLIDKYKKDLSEIKGTSFAGTDGTQGENKNLLTANFTVASDNSTSTISREVSESGSAAAFRLPSESELIDALAIFIANRMKEELALTFVNNFKQKLENDSSIALLFPNTLVALDLSDNFQQPVFGSRWQQALASDVASLPRHLLCSKMIDSDPFLKELTPLIDLFRYQQQGYNLFDAALLTAQDLNTQNQGTGFRKALLLMRMFATELGDTSKAGIFLPLSAIGRMSDDEFRIYTGLLLQRYEPVLNEFGIMRDAKNAPTPDELVYLRSEIIRMLAAFQQLQQAVTERRNGKSPDAKENVEAMWDASRAILLTAVRFNQNSPKRKINSKVIERFIATADKIFLMYKDIAAKNYTAMLSDGADLLGEIIMRRHAGDDRMNGEYLKRLLRDVPAGSNGDTIKAMITRQLRNPAYIDVSAVKKLLQKEEVESSRITQAVAAVSRQAQAGGTFDIAALEKQLDSLLQKDERKKVLALLLTQMERPDSITAFIKDLRRMALQDPKVQQWIQNALNLRTLYDSLAKEETGDRYVEIMRILSFIADALKAPDSKALSQVIDVYAAPANSYRIKRSTRASIDLNAYPGLFTGAEWRMQQATGIDKFGVTSGFTCPVGFSFSRGSRRTLPPYGNVTDKTFIGKKNRVRTLTGYSHTLTLTVIDIGAVVAYRLSGDSANGLPKQVTFSQIFSPGLYYEFGFRNAPLSLNIGAQVNPKLRSFNDGEPPKDALRFSVGLVFDIPLYNLYYRDIH